MNETGFAEASRAMDSLALSDELRLETASLHERIEALLGLPDAIATRDDYVRWLARFQGFYDPVECALAPLGAWHGLGLAQPPGDHSSRLTLDLTALGVDETALPQLPSSQLPSLSRAAQAIGACYVLEGATLGGRVILRDLVPRLGPEIMGATHFFSGRVDGAATRWPAFRAALDDFGRA